MTLGEVARERQERAEAAPQATVYSVTKYDGFVPSLEYFGRQVFSRDTANYRVVRRGDLAYATIHLDEGSLGLFDAADAGLISPMYTVLEVTDASVDARVLFSLLKRPAMIAQIGRLGAGSVHRRKSIPFSALSRTELDLPPLLEQRAIVGILGVIDEAIAESEGTVAATEALRHALLHELLRSGMPGRHARRKEWPVLGPLPAAWSVSTLGALGRWTTGGTPSKHRGDFWQGAIPWISPKDMKVSEIWGATDHITEAGAAAGSALAEPGAILVVVRGMILAHSFPIAVLRVRCAFNQDIRALTCVPGILPEYVVLALEAQRHALVDLATPTTHGTMRIVLDSLLSRPIALPSPSEQADIVAAVATVREKVSRERDFLDVLRSVKSAVRSALLSGRTRMGVPVAGGHVG